MTQLNITLPERLKDAVDEQVARGGFHSASAYFQRLIRDDQKRRAREELEGKLLEGLKGTGKEMKPADWVRVRREVAKRVAKQNRPGGRKAT